MNTISIRNQETISEQDLPKNNNPSSLKDFFRKTLGIGAACMALLTSAQSQAEEENAIFFDLYTSPFELFKVNGLGFGYGRELYEDINIHMGFEVGGHCELGLYTIDGATFRQRHPVFAGACLATVGPSFGFEIDRDWHLELVPHGGIGGLFVFPGSVGSDYYQNSAVKGPFGVVGLEVLVKKDIGYHWHYYFGAAYHGLIRAEEPSAPRGTRPNDYTNDVHIIPVGFEYGF